MLGEGRVHIEHAHGFSHGFLAGGMSGMPFLPQELRRSQEHARTHFPADHVRPLIDEQWQIAIALDPARERIADDRLGGRTHDQRLIELAGRHELAF